MCMLSCILTMHVTQALPKPCSHFMKAKYRIEDACYNTLTSHCLIDLQSTANGVMSTACHMHHACILWPMSTYAH